MSSRVFRKLVAAATLMVATQSVFPQGLGAPAALGAGADVGASLTGLPTLSGASVTPLKSLAEDRAEGSGKITASKQATPDSALVNKGELVSRGSAPPVLPMNEFQKFVLQSTGKSLSIYGADFFSSGGSYLPSSETPVSPDHKIGPGDEIRIRVWGSIDFDISLIVDREGLVTIPRVGTVALAGVKAGEATAVIKSALDKYFRGYNINVAMGKIRGISIFVVGQARQPGTYQVSSLATAVTALFQSGGPNAQGSLRHVQVKRGDKVVAELDLYALISKGDKSADVRLLDGDVLVIPPAYGYAALIGEVESPKIFELKDKSESLSEILDFAGGLPIVANPRVALIEQLDPNLIKPRSVVEVSLDPEGRKRILQSGDIVSVLPVRGEFNNVVILRGALDAPVRMRHYEGMRISDLIPNKAFLVSRSVVSRQFDQVITNPAVSVVGNKFEIINWNYAAIERMDYERQKTTLVPFNLGRALESPSSSDNLVLQPGDTVNIFTANDARLPIEKTPVYVRIEGEVLSPGVYQARPGETLATLVERAGGLTENANLFGSEFTRESIRVMQQKNLERLLVKLEQQSAAERSRSSQNLSAYADAAALQVKLAAEESARNRSMQQLRQLKPTGRVALAISAESPNIGQLPSVILENDDRFYVPPRQEFVQVLGHVQIESAMLWQKGNTVSDYLREAGLMADADEKNILVVRADGRIASNYGRWLSSLKGQVALPGDIIVVPELSDKETTWSFLLRNFKDISQILSGFGLTAAAVKTLSK